MIRKKINWGFPIVHIHFKYGENEKAMKKDVEQSAVEMLTKSRISQYPWVQL